MNLNDYFDPVSLENPVNDHLSDKAVFCRNIYIHTPDSPITRLQEFGIALMGVPEDRGASLAGSAMAPDLIRQKLYQLFRVICIHKQTPAVDRGVPQVVEHVLGNTGVSQGVAPRGTGAP